MTDVTSPPEPSPAAPDLTDPSLYFNRETSWMEFNDRVLQLAEDPDTPLLERLKFLAIVSSNLDEFFMVRVAGLHDQIDAGIEKPLQDGRTPKDTLDAIRRAVREQVKYGADWIKFYADRRYYVKDGALHSWVNFTEEEMKAMVDESHRLGRPVAAHAMGWDGIDASLKAGVDSIEHGYGLDEGLMDRMVRQGTYWCPTIYVGAYVAE